MKVLPKITLAEYLAGRESVPAHVLSPELEQAIVDQPYSDREYHTREVVKMNKVRIQYGERIILNDLDWTVMNGERWALSGQNGAGKSTLSNVLVGNPEAAAKAYGTSRNTSATYRLSFTALTSATCQLSASWQAV